MTGSTTITDDMPACRDTVDEILALWNSLGEVSPGQGIMPATIADFTNVEADAQVIEDASVAFDRLVSMHDRKEALVDLSHRFLDNRACRLALGGGVILGVAAVIHNISHGHIPATPTHHDSIREAFEQSPISSTILATIGAGTVAALANEVLDRGYARFAGLSDALHRLQDGANPRSDSLKDKLTETERETYGEILRLSYSVAAGQDPSTQERFLKKLGQSMRTIVENLENTPQAGMIQETLNGLRDALEAQASAQEAPGATTMQHAAPAGPGF